MTDLAAARRYERRKTIVRIAGMVILVIYAALWTLAAPHVAEAAGELTAWRWLGLLAVGAAFVLGLELVSLPLDAYAEFGIEHAFNLSNQTPKAWLARTVKEWLVGVVFGGLMVAGLYASLWYGGRLWWLWVWMGWLGLSVGLVKLFPVLILPLFYKSQPVDNAALHERFTRLAAGTALTIRGILRFSLSEETKKANAMLVGLGSTRRVYLSDTLMDAFTEDEIGVVFAHELGHHIHGHITKGIALSAAISTLVVALIAMILSPFAGGEASLWPEAVSRLPAVVLAVSAFSYAMMPLGNAIMRRFERQCDAEALARTRDPAAYRAAFRKLGEMNLANPDPARWIEILFHDHPALSRRIAMADGWEPARAGAAAGPPAQDLDAGQAVVGVHADDDVGKTA